MDILSRVGICKDPSSIYYVDVAGPANFDDLLNLIGRVYLTDTSSIEAASGSAGAVSIGEEATTTSINLGTAAHAKTITIGGSSDQVIIQGTVTTNNSVDLTVQDKLITLNKDGLAGTANNSGIEFEEDGSITGFFRVGNFRAEFIMKAPDRAGTFAFQPPADPFELNLRTSSLTANRVWTFPNTTDTFAGLATSQTLSNKTLSSGILSGTTTVAGTLNVSATSTFSGATTFSSSATFSSTINSNLVPSGTRTLGTSGSRWSSVFTTSLNNSGSLTVGGTLDANGNVDLGGAASDTISFVGRVDTAIEPISDNSRDLGSPIRQWRDLFTRDAHVNVTYTNALVVYNNTTFGDSTATDTVTFNARVASFLSPTGNEAHNLGGAADRWDTLWAASANFSGSISVSQNNAAGGGIVLGDDGSIVDNNDGYCTFRISEGIRVTDGKNSNTVVTTLNRFGDGFFNAHVQAQRFSTGNGQIGWQVFRRIIFPNTPGTVDYLTVPAGTRVVGATGFYLDAGGTSIIDTTTSISWTRDSNTADNAVKVSVPSTSPVTTLEYRVTVFYEFI